MIHLSTHDVFNATKPTIKVSLQNFGLNFFQAQAFGLRNIDNHKQKREQSDCAK